MIAVTHMRTLPERDDNQRPHAVPVHFTVVWSSTTGSANRLQTADRACHRRSNGRRQTEIREIAPRSLHLRPHHPTQTQDWPLRHKW
jgi:hypothetical protein